MGQIGLFWPRQLWTTALCKVSDMHDFIKKIRRRINKSVLQYGVISTIGRCLVWPIMYLTWRIIEMSPYKRQARLAGQEFDKAHHVNTERDRLSEWAADIDSPNWAAGTGYSAALPENVRASIRALAIAHEDYTAIDIGSGKGRVLLVASEFAFNELLGVEYAPDLHEIALQNIAAYHSDKQRCHNIKSVCADAVTFSLPEAPLVLFFHHPFGGSTLEKFLQGVQRSLKSHPRNIKVIYGDPIDGELFEKAGFQKIGSKALRKSTVFRKFVLRHVGWFPIVGNNNQQGMEYVIYDNVVNNGDRPVMPT